MVKNRLSLGLLLLLLLPLLITAAPAPPGQAPSQAVAQSERMQQGRNHFERAFYQLTPQKRDVEAAREFDLAIAEFEAELVVQPQSAEAHAYLARIYAVRKNFAKAAAHYDRLSDLQPTNVDACVLAALAYVDNGQVAEARERLVAARARTEDPDVLAKLSDYIARLDLLKR